MYKKLTIYCCYHDVNQIHEYNLLERPSFKLFYGPDGLLNPYLSEHSMFYWIWKNDVESEYIGICHYRRLIYENDFDETKVNDNSCQVWEVIYDNTGIYGLEKWCSNEWYQCEWLWKDYVDYVTEKYGPNNEYLMYDKLLYDYKIPKLGAFMVRRNMFIMTRKHFMNMCDYIFGFVDYLDKKYKLNYDPENYRKWTYLNWFDKTNGKIPFDMNDPKNLKRFLGLSLEWLTSLYIQVNIDTIHTL